MFYTKIFDAILGLLFKNKNVFNFSTYYDKFKIWKIKIMGKRYLFYSLKLLNLKNEQNI